MLEATARPAASSPALLIRFPVDRRSIAVVIALSFLAIAFDAKVALTFVFITVMGTPSKAYQQVIKLHHQTNAAKICEHFSALKEPLFPLINRILLYIILISTPSPLPLNHLT
jgi:hypothetical protein